MVERGKEGEDKKQYVPPLPTTFGEGGDIILSDRGT